MNAIAIVAMLAVGQNPNDLFGLTYNNILESGPMTTFVQARARAAKENKPLILFVGVRVRPIRGAVCHDHWESSPNYPVGRIVVFHPKGSHGWMYWTDANDADLLEGGRALQPRPFLKPLRLRPVSGSSNDLLKGRLETADAEGNAGGPRPFIGKVVEGNIIFSTQGFSMPSVEIRTVRFIDSMVVDDDGNEAGPWPATVDFNDKLVLYRPAQWTQEIATTNGAPRITPVHRFNLPRKWHQPGGMEGLTGWRSDLYKHVPEGWQRQWTDRLSVLNSFGNFQNELGWTRAYPDGTEFHDVLSNAETGEVFEHRLAEKKDGRWDRRVVYRNRAAHPVGYKGLQGLQCASCHQEAGTGGYGVALVPGADTVLSDPFPGLER